MIGVAECIDIPAWQVEMLPAKVDTGARTSALHVENLIELGKNRVRFEVPLHAGRPNERVTIEAPIERRALVRSTSGEVRPRLFVSVRVRIGSIERRIELGLVDRRNMQFRMLIGRSALARAFLVDVSKTYLISGRPKTLQQRALAERIAREEERRAALPSHAGRVVGSSREEHVTSQRKAPRSVVLTARAARPSSASEASRKGRGPKQAPARREGVSSGASRAVMHEASKASSSGARGAGALRGVKGRRG